MISCDTTFTQSVTVACLKSEFIVIDMVLQKLKNQHKTK